MSEYAVTWICMDYRFLEDFMKLTLVRTQPRRRSVSPAQQMLDDYIGRVGRMHTVEVIDLPDENAVGAWLDKVAARGKARLVLADSTGQNLSSEELARWVGESQQVASELIFAVGPADGWSAAMLRRAHLKIAFGRITLPHELAAVVLAEQVYRAFAILAGHPYHGGH
jgi:23S rRNA (pseudouridine1915-N3)-methyltransferase